MKNKYLEELGLKKGEYGSNYSEITRKQKKKFKKQRKKYGFDERETWNINTILIEWLYSHLMMYTEKGGKVVDLEYHTFEFKGRTYTELEAIEFIKEKCCRYLSYELTDDDVTYDEINAEMTEALHLLAEIFPALWW